MNRKELVKLHRGVDNQVRFVVKNLDYKKVDIEHFVVRAKVVDTINSEVMLEKYADVGTCKGEITLDIFEGDLADVPPGFYQLVLQAEESISTKTPDQIVASPFYNNQNSDISFDVEVTNQGNATPHPSTILDPEKWYPLFSVNEPKTLISSAVSCNAIRNHKNSIHTFVVYSTNFTGHIELLGSLDINPPTDVIEYFPVEITPGSTKVEFEEFTGIEAFTVQSNLVWVKFRLVFSPNFPSSDNGKIDKVVWRS